LPGASQVQFALRSGRTFSRFPEVLGLFGQALLKRLLVLSTTTLFQGLSPCSIPAPGAKLLRASQKSRPLQALERAGPQQSIRCDIAIFDFVKNFGSTQVAFGFFVTFVSFCSGLTTVSSALRI
jgi:hypothetical protein